MGRHDWYRNTCWNAEIEKTFRAKLSRARSSRPQYIQIQAAQLVSASPDVSLALIDEYFETGDKFFVPNAFCTRASAYCALGKIPEAVIEYKRALEWEQAHPNFITMARIDLPKLIVENKLIDEYSYALDILTTRFKASDQNFPITRYLWNGCCALITYHRKDIVEAREFAERALRAATETESSFRYHRSLGVVTDISDEFGRRLQRIARPSILRSFFKLI